MRRAAVGCGDAGDDVAEGGAAEGGVQVGLDSFFALNEVWRNVCGEVVVSKVYGAEVGKLSEGGWDGAGECAVVEKQLSERREIAKLRRKFSAKIVAMKSQEG